MRRLSKKNGTVCRFTSQTTLLTDHTTHFSQITLHTSHNWWYTKQRRKESKRLCKRAQFLTYLSIGMKTSWATSGLTAQAGIRAPSCGWWPTTIRSAPSTTTSTGPPSQRLRRSGWWLPQSLRDTRKLFIKQHCLSIRLSLFRHFCLCGKPHYNRCCLCRKLC